jgi:GPH family glycoside/pentoside/hexuronide:cation symporter
MSSNEDILKIEILPNKTKFAYGFGEFVHIILSNVAFAAITFYYNVKLGLDEQLIGLAWLIFAFWNAINDPLFGFIQDRTKSKWGRRIPYIRFGAPIYGILFIMVWIPLVDITNEIALFIYLLFILFTFDSIYTIIGLIMYSMPAEMVISSKARANLMIYGSIFSSLGFLVALILPILLLTGSESASVDPTFLIIMIIVGILCASVLFICSFYLKENKYTQLEEPMGMFESLKETFKNKPFLIFEVSIFSFILAQTILTTAVFYYIDYILNLGGFIALLPILLFFAMVLGFTFSYSKLAGKHGLKKIYIFSLILSGLGFILGFFIAWSLIPAIIAFIIIGIGFSGIFLTQQALFAETIDYDEILTTKRRETSYSGVNALITKPAISIANFLFLAIISLYGFQRATQTQTESAQLGIMIGFMILPALFILISALAIKFFPLDGTEWIQQKIELKKTHDEKENAYLTYLKEQGVL